MSGATADTTNPADTAPAPVDPTATIASDELRTLAMLALRNQQLHSPAGANAIEYYLALRQRAVSPDAMVESALFDLMPYAVIAAERAIEQADMTELERLRGLIARIDPTAPALPRLDEKLVEGRHAQQLERRRALAAEQAAAEAAAKAAAKPATQADGAAVASVRSAPAPANASMAAATPVPRVTKLAPHADDVAPDRSTPPSEAVAPPAQSQGLVQLVPVRTPQPPFPAEARRRGQPGSVDVEFVVDRDGSVTEVRVLNSSKRVFERPVLLTVRRWQFEPLASPMTVRRSFTFTPQS